MQCRAGVQVPPPSTMAAVAMTVEPFRACVAALFLVSTATLIAFVRSPDRAYMSVPRVTGADDVK